MAAKRSAAARKGWETRRRHEREKKRKQRKRRIRRTQEWIIKTEYQPKQGGGKGGPAGRLVLTDIRVITPITWTREKVEQEIQRFAFGEKVKGLKVKAFDWARKEGAETKPTAAQVQDMGRFAAVFMDPETKFDIRKEKN